MNTREEKGTRVLEGRKTNNIFLIFGIVYIHRLTEVCSRIGLLACLGYMYDGRAIPVAVEQIMYFRYYKDSLMKSG